MKQEEAIRAIEVLRDIDINYPPTQQDVADTEGAVELAIQALEKQIPKKVIIEKNGAKRCPSCGVKHFNPNWKPEVCNCTQKLDWGKE